jgi:hypothetical protein
MKYFFLLFSFLSLTANSQTRIIGRLLDYDSHSPIANCIVKYDTSHANVGFQIENAVLTNDSGYFQLDCKLKSPKIDIMFSQVGYEKLVISTIPNSFDTTLNLKNIWMLEGSYNWDGNCIKKYLWGLIKIKKRCGGYIKGLLEKNNYPSIILIKYPKDSAEKSFTIVNRSLTIDYRDITK